MDEDQERRFAQAERLRRGYRRTVSRRLIVGVLGVLLLVGGIGALTAYQVQERGGTPTPDHASSDFGFTLTAANLQPSTSTKRAPHVVEVQLWDDFFCAECRAFNKTIRAYLRHEVRAGRVELTYHPYVTGTDSSTNTFAERAANAAACVGDSAGAKGYAAMHDRLLDKQPKSGQEGADDEELVAWARSVGAKKAEACIVDRTFLPWLEEAAIEARRNDITTTPTIKVAGRTIVSPGKNGGEVLPDKRELKFAIDAAADR